MTHKFIRISHNSWGKLKGHYKSEEIVRSLYPKINYNGHTALRFGMGAQIFPPIPLQQGSVLVLLLSWREEQR